jgi:hypothetical protein
MKCCVQCFNDPFLVEYIGAHGEPGDCDFCGAETAIDVSYRVAR